MAPAKPGVRIASGSLRGRRLEAGADVRPTEGRVREALIDRWRPRLQGARVLDLFAGTGAVGFHSLSCGAARCVFVDRSRRNLRAIEEASKRWGVADRVECVEAILPVEIDRVTGRFDLAFADPPYDFEAYGELVQTAAARVATDGELAVEHRSSDRIEIEEGIATLLDSRVYGSCALAFVEGTAQEATG